MQIKICNSQIKMFDTSYKHPIPMTSTVVCLNESVADLVIAYTGIHLLGYRQMHKYVSSNMHPFALGTDIKSLNFHPESSLYFLDS